MSKVICGDRRWFIVVNWLRIHSDVIHIRRWSKRNLRTFTFGSVSSNDRLMILIAAAGLHLILHARFSSFSKVLYNVSVAVVRWTLHVIDEISGWITSNITRCWLPMIKAMLKLLMTMSIDRLVLLLFFHPSSLGTRWIDFPNCALPNIDGHLVLPLFALIKSNREQWKLKQLRKLASMCHLRRCSPYH